MRAVNERRPKFDSNRFVVNFLRLSVVRHIQWEKAGKMNEFHNYCYPLLLVTKSKIFG